MSGRTEQFWKRRWVRWSVTGLVFVCVSYMLWTYKKPLPPLDLANDTSSTTDSNTTDNGTNGNTTDSTTPQYTPDAAEQTVSDYEKDFSDALANYDFSVLSPVLMDGSQIYTDQQNLISSLKSKGTSEKLTNFNITSTSNGQIDGEYLVDTDETYNITYSDGSQKQIEQTVEYTVNEGVSPPALTNLDVLSEQTLSSTPSPASNSHVNSTSSDGTGSSSSDSESNILQPISTISSNDYQWLITLYKAVQQDVVGVGAASLFYQNHDGVAQEDAYNDFAFATVLQSYPPDNPQLQKLNDAIVRAMGVQQNALHSLAQDMSNRNDSAEQNDLSTINGAEVAIGDIYQLIYKQTLHAQTSDGLQCPLLPLP